jgi:hypothetical protein
VYIPSQGAEDRRELGEDQRYVWDRIQLQLDVPVDKMISRSPEGSIPNTDHNDDAGFVLPSRLPILSAHSCHPGGSIFFFPGRHQDGSPRIYVSRSHRGTKYIESGSLFREDSCITHLCPCHTIEPKAA